MNNSKKIAATCVALIGMGVTALGSAPVSAQVPPPPTVGFHHRKNERHPELRRAYQTLKRVEMQLRHSSRDFGGHRAQAADLCQQAEQQIMLAFQADRGPK